jgi:hypothetical protein
MAILLRRGFIPDAAVKAYTFIDEIQAQTTDGSGNFSKSETFGTGTFLIVVGVSTFGNTAGSVSVGGTSLTLATSDTTGQFAGLYYGVVTTSGSATVQLTAFTASAQIGVTVWKCSGLSSNSPKQAVHWGGTPSTTINVTAVDFMFSQVYDNAAGSITFAGSTEVPTRSNAFTNVFGYGDADWTIIATNAAFTVSAGGDGSLTAVAVTFA